jgi:Carboxypeptidase regulatory-like domain
MSWSTLRRSTAAALVSGLVTLTSSGVLMAGAPSSLTGRVLMQNGADPRPGVVVALVEPASERAYRSSPTDARGAFTIDAAPAGDYALLVEAPEGAFLASSHVQLAPGVNRPVSLALKPGRQDEPPAGSTPPEPKKSGPPTWAKWVIAGAVVVGAAIVVDAVTKNDEASKFF